MAKSNGVFQNERQVFHEHIQKCGLKKTAQRDLILEVFLNTEDHLSSENLYWLVQQRDPAIGHTTVYRTLKLLTEAGLAREVRLGDGKSYYEHHYNQEHHDHIICTGCGRVVEFFSPELEKMQEEIAMQYNFKLTHHTLRILGYCEVCQQKELHSMSSGAQPRVRVVSGKSIK